MSETTTQPAGTEAPTAAVADDLLDERLIQEGGLAGAARVFVRRVRGGDLGSLPVIVGLIVIAIVFQALDDKFLSPRTLVTMAQFAAPIGIIALGVVLVLLLGEIDLSVGSVSGLAAAILAWVIVYQELPLYLGLLAGIAGGAAIGISYGLLYTRFGVPSFVITLAGLLGFLGLQLMVLGDRGTVNLPADSALIEFARRDFVTGAPAYLLVVVVVAAYAAVQVLVMRRRAAAQLSTPPVSLLMVKVGALLVAGLFTAYYLGQDRGLPYLVLLFIALVVVMDVVLRRTTWGRHVFAVGGNEEAARRAGIKVDRIYISVFMLTGMLASLGGILAAAQLTSVSQASGGTDTNLTAIAAAVIGGTSLFGGRGTAWAALLGIIVLQSIQSGLNLINVESEIRYMVTGAVLLLAVSIDSVSRRARTSSGRG